MGRRIPVEDRFWSKVDKSGARWLWTAAINWPQGYGTIKVEGKMVGAHRVAYELAVGPIPDGLQLDHLCRVRQCVNPSHLEPVTQRENLMRGESVPARQSRQTHCIHGHEFTPENTLIQAPNNRRQCRACRRLYMRARRLRLQAASQAAA
jgi:hypothetical protein